MKRLIYFLMALLGFGTACGSVNGPDIDDVAPMYAPIRCNYSVKARVVDEAGQAIPGIKVTDANFYYNDYLGTTDENGVVDAVLTGYDGMLQSVRFDDVDGEANGGEFESLTIEAESYYDSEHDITVCDLGDVTMTKVENEDK